jgi:phosphatidylserine decarboxylase
VSVTSFAAAQLLRVLPRVKLSRAVGQLCEQSLPPTLSRAIERAYCAAYKVDLSDVLPRSGPYQSFDEFFTRPLKPGARTVSHAAVVSPADGLLACSGPVDSGARILVKGKPYEVGELLGDPAEARRYTGGQFAVVYLSPRDYHRVHSPVDGQIGLVRGIPGDQYPVNSLGEKHVPKLFARNQRVVMFVETKGLGTVAVVMVGATIVGRISVSALPVPRVPPGDHTIEPAQSVSRGDEIGIFHLGSTVVMFLEPGTTIGRHPGEILFGESLLGDA